jgi:hypothetical protein
MPGIPRDVAEHSLDIRAGARPVKQSLRRFDEEKRRAIGEEVHRLMATGFIKEVFHPEWLANHVLVKEKRWEMEDVRRLHWCKQSMFEGSLPSASHRSNCGLYCWVRNCDGTSQVIRPTYSCPCLTDIRQPCRCS